MFRLQLITKRSRHTIIQINQRISPRFGPHSITCVHISGWEPEGLYRSTMFMLLEPFWLSAFDRSTSHTVQTELTLLSLYRPLSARRAQTLCNTVLLRTRRTLWQYKVYDVRALLVLSKTVLNNVNALLALNWRYQLSNVRKFSEEVDGGGGGTSMPHSFSLWYGLALLLHAAVRVWSRTQLSVYFQTLFWRCSPVTLILSRWVNHHLAWALFVRSVHLLSTQSNYTHWHVLITECSKHLYREQDCHTLTKVSKSQITQIWESDVFRLDLAYSTSIPSLEQKHSSCWKIFKSRHRNIELMSMYTTDTFCSFMRNVICKSCFLLSEYGRIMWMSRLTQHKLHVLKRSWDLSRGRLVDAQRTQINSLRYWQM